MERLVKVTRGGQITIPADIRRQVGIEIGDLVEVRLEQGRMVLLPKLLVDKDQAWFWTKDWQAAEREAEEDLRTGHTETYNNLGELIAGLDADEPED